MRTLFYRIRGRWRLTWGRCPKCNSASPIRCSVCRGYYSSGIVAAGSYMKTPSKSKRFTWWRRYEKELSRR